MPAINSGSIAANILASINPMPVGISGILPTIVDQQRFFVEQFTGITIGASIGEPYQSAITDLATANTLKLMAVQDMGVSEVIIGEMRVYNANLTEMAKEFEARGMKELQSLSKGLKLFKARG